MVAGEPAFSFNEGGKVKRGSSVGDEWLTFRTKLAIWVWMGSYFQSSSCLTENDNDG